MVIVDADLRHGPLERAFLSRSRATEVNNAPVHSNPVEYLRDTDNGPE
jgi:hypothetical protein